VLPLRLVVPLYTAVIEGVPTIKVDVFTFKVASVAVPSFNVTLPLSDAPAGGLTDAVQVTDFAVGRRVSEGYRCERDTRELHRGFSFDVLSLAHPSV